MNELNADDLVRVARAESSAEAHVIQQILGDEGIACHVVGEFRDAVLSFASQEAPAEVWVHVADQARAEKALNSDKRRNWQEKRN